ncbi:YitT family protein [Virgibacillus sp. MSJ-26]|uniref:YitT family protein n=1 Tax=Virgibacillus sp. MSJ-26 TaxID=2841522 RepID=UPI001C114417|nr:YitT family protein [Virgibacillus sp. MSJ-26]MBU5467364.1 YitT family protein [Virgibacillus sp. MSJ-26]
MKTQLNPIEILIIIFGSILFAFGINYFTIPNQLSEGGITGLTVIIHYLSDWSTGLINFTLNIILFTFSVKYLDKKEIIYTLIAIVVSSTALFYTEGVETVFTSDTLLASVFAGLFVGMGIGLIFRSGGTMGGTTIIARILNQFLGMSVGSAMLFIDIVVVIGSIYIIGIEKALYTVIAVYVGAKVMDTIIKGKEEKVAVTIISRYETKILNEVLTRMSRGITVLEGRGGFSNQRRELLYLVINKYEIPTLKDIIYGIDDEAYVTIYTVSEIIGKGFKARKEKGKTPVK